MHGYCFWPSHAKNATGVAFYASSDYTLTVPGTVSLTGVAFWSPGVQKPMGFWSSHAESVIGVAKISAEPRKRTLSVPSDSLRRPTKREPCVETLAGKKCFYITSRFLGPDSAFFLSKIPSRPTRSFQEVSKMSPSGFQDGFSGSLQDPKIVKMHDTSIKNQVFWQCASNTF